MDIDKQDTEPAGEDESFAELFEKTYRKQDRLVPGQMVEAVIVKIASDWIFLDLGGKGEGTLDRKELQDENGSVTVKEGDTVRVYFVSADNTEMHFTTKVGSGPGKQSQLEDAWRNRIPVEGAVTKEIKGGFEVKIGGTVRAFCPFSQMGVRRDTQAAAVLGKTLAFQIIEYGENGRNIVLSRRPILDEERRQKKESLRETLQEGMKLSGTVTSLQKFGAFIDIGGIEGLLPVSEIAWGRTERPGDVLAVGQQVEVIVKRLDWEHDKLSFSLKDTLPDPWEGVVEAYPVGSYHHGTVARLAPFGAFITLQTGVDGLLHISRLHAGKRINHPREVLHEGQSVEVKIEGVDRGQRRISLSLAEQSRAAEEEATSVADYQEQAAAESQQTGGTLGDLLREQMEKKNGGEGTGNPGA